MAAKHQFVREPKWLGNISVLAQQRDTVLEIIRTCFLILVDFLANFLHYSSTFVCNEVKMSHKTLALNVKEKKVVTTHSTLH